MHATSHACTQVWHMAFYSRSWALLYPVLAACQVPPAYAGHHAPWPGRHHMTHQ
jgi:hypothetical protein